MTLPLCFSIVIMFMEFLFFCDHIYGIFIFSILWKKVVIIYPSTCHVTLDFSCHKSSFYLKLSLTPLEQVSL